MAAGLAHEIRNPITSIGVHCGLLRMRCQDDTQIVSSLSHIESETGKVESIIRECLNFVRPPVLNLSTVSITSMLERLVADTGKMYPKISFSLHMETAGPVHAEVDEVMFEQALRNSIMNAAQAVSTDRSDGQVMVAARLSKGFWDLDPKDKEPELQAGAGEREYFLMISIKDNAMGIPANVMDKIFVPFFTTKKGGTGIGLAIVQKIINAHKGVLDIISEPEKGAEFIIKIPLRSSFNA
jgi:two-component system sensor histidine kinase AtoS